MGLSSPYSTATLTYLKRKIITDKGIFTENATDIAKYPYQSKWRLSQEWICSVGSTHPKHIPEIVASDVHPKIELPSYKSIQPPLTKYHKTLRNSRDVSSVQFSYWIPYTGWLLKNWITSSWMMKIPNKFG